MPKTRTDIELQPSGYGFPMLFVASYNELEQLHMQVLLNYYLATAQTNKNANFQNSK